MQSDDTQHDFRQADRAWMAAVKAHVADPSNAELRDNEADAREDMAVKADLYMRSKLDARVQGALDHAAMLEAQSKTPIENALEALGDTDPELAEMIKARANR